MTDQPYSLFSSLMACCLKNRFPPDRVFPSLFLRMLLPFLYEEVGPLIIDSQPLADQFLSTLFVAWLCLDNHEVIADYCHFYDTFDTTYILVGN